eukprot:3446706-Amphidinium_carterae.1
MGFLGRLFDSSLEGGIVTLSRQCVNRADAMGSRWQITSEVGSIVQNVNACSKHFVYCSGAAFKKRSKPFLVCERLKVIDLEWKLQQCCLEHTERGAACLKSCKSASRPRIARPLSCTTWSPQATSTSGCKCKPSFARQRPATQRQLLLASVGLRQA